MPLLRKGVLIPSKGVDWSQPSTFISERAGFPENMTLYRSEMRKRFGKSAYGSALSSAAQVMGFGILELASVKYLLRASKTELEYYNTSSEAWSSIISTAFTGGNEDFFFMDTVSESGLVAITNGYDKIRKWTGSGNAAALGGNPPFAKYLAYITPYLILAHIDDGATVSPWKVQWCDTDDPEDWSSGNSGSALLSKDGSPIQNIKRLNEYAAVYKEKSLWLGRGTDSDIWKFDLIKTGIGLGAPRGLAEAEGKHYFQGFNDFYLWNGATPISIGAPVRDKVFSSLDRSKAKRCFAIHIKNLKEIWFFIVVSGGTWPTEVWKYNYGNGFWYYDTCASLTAAIIWQRTATQSWNDDTPGSWDEAQDTWDAADSIEDWEEVVFGHSNGATSKLDYNTTNDLDVAVSAHFVSKDFIGDLLEFNKRWLQLDLWAWGGYGHKVYVDYSTDFGVSWTNIPHHNQSSDAYITLTEASQHFRFWFDILSPQIRFRFRNYEDDEVFYIRNFYPYYLPMEESRR